jgi:hypothetical protein
MAIKLIANYSKRLGLPGYSSHQFSVSLETELAATNNMAGESQRLYQLLQTNIAEQILTVGFVPPSTYGMDPPEETHDANHAPNGSANNSANSHGIANNGSNWQRGPAWKCSDKQRDLILKRPGMTSDPSGNFCVLMPCRRVAEVEDATEVEAEQTSAQTQVPAIAA